MHKSHKLKARAEQVRKFKIDVLLERRSQISSACYSLFGFADEPYCADRLTEIKGALLKSLGIEHLCNVLTLPLFQHLATTFNNTLRADIAFEIEEGRRPFRLSAKSLEEQFLFLQILHRAQDTAQRMDDFGFVLFKRKELDSGRFERFQRDVGLFVLLSLGDLLTVHLKYQTNFLFCLAMNQEPPTRNPNYPLEDGFLTHLKWNKYMRLLCCRLKSRKVSLKNGHGVARKDLIILYSLFQGLKKGFHPMVESEIVSSLKKHSKTLTMDPPEHEHSAEDAVERVCHWLFPRKIHEDDIRYGLDFQFSRKSCVEKKLAKGGLLREVIETVRPVTISDSLSFPQLVGYQHSPYGEKPLYLRVSALELVQSSIQKWKEYASDPNILPLCVPSVVLEPNKARIITKGECFNYALLRPVQRKMWQGLKDKKQFSLIGEKLTGIHLQMFEKAHGDGDFEQFFVSADYSAATDGLNMNLSKVALREILSGRLLALARKALTETEVCYLRDEIENIQMKNGQLMGSLLSFPILCILNFACLLLSVEAWTGKRMKPSDLVCLVNGDDLLFEGSRGLIAVWEENLKQFGFQKSVGKNFVSNSFLQLNSQMWIVDQSEDIRTFEKVPYINFGHILDRRKGSDEDIAMKEASFLLKIEESCKENRVFIPKGMAERAQDLMIRVHRHRLPNMMWYVPRSEGGLGFFPFRSYDYPDWFNRVRLQRVDLLSEIFSESNLLVKPVDPFCMSQQDIQWQLPKEAPSVSWISERYWRKVSKMIDRVDGKTREEILMESEDRLHRLAVEEKCSFSTFLPENCHLGNLTQDVDTLFILKNGV